MNIFRFLSLSLFGVGTLIWKFLPAVSGLVSYLLFAPPGRGRRTDRGPARPCGASYQTGGGSAIFEAQQPEINRLGPAGGLVALSIEAVDGADRGPAEAIPAIALKPLGVRPLADL